MRPAKPYSLTPLEIACGLVFGSEERRAAVPDLPADATPTSALEAATMPALRRPPCLVSFSGGRDSSAVLAVAVRLARREGLPLPIPATNRFPAAELSDEREWQERVVTHLGLDDWIRLEFTDELDCVGPIATRILRRHGLLWPFNAHFHAPLLAEAAGGSLLTGAGGDEVLVEPAWARANAVITGQVLPRPRDLLRVGLAVSPRPVKWRVLRGRHPTNMLPWLHEGAHRAVMDAWAAEAADQPLGWAARFRWWRGLRYVRVSHASLAVLAADHDVQIVHPLADAGFSTALGLLPRARRFRSRTEAMRMLFGDLLPDDVLARGTKASFDEAFWSKHSRELVARWNGEGVDPRLVDLDVLRRLWTSDEIDGRSFLLLQAVRLAMSGTDRVEQELSTLRK